MAQPLGNYLRARRHELGLSLRDLEAASGIQRARLSQLETGQRPLSLATCKQLAPALGLRVADLALAAGQVAPDLPSLQPYLRQAYGLDARGAADVERYIQERYGALGLPAPGEDEQPEPEGR